MRTLWVAALAGAMIGVGCGGDEGSGDDDDDAAAPGGGGSSGAAHAGGSGGSSVGGSATGGSATGGSDTGGSAGTGPETGGSATTGGSDTGGTGGDATGGAGGADIPPDPVPTSGCGQPPPPLGEVVAGPNWGVNPDYTYSVDVGGVTRTYVLRYPDNYDSNHPYPVVFMFHGTGGDGQRFDYTRVEQSAPEGGAIFVLPVGLDYEWAQDTGWETFNDDLRDLEFFDAMWEKIRSEYCVDEGRVFASGHSIGGFMTNYLGCQRGDVFRAIAPIAGGGMGDWWLRSNDCVGQVATMIIHGTDDTDVSYDSGVRVRDYFLEANHCGDTTATTDHPPCERYQGCDADFPVEMCTFQGGGHSDFDWSELGADIWDFFASF